MDIIIKTGFQSIKHTIEFQPQTKIKGKNLVLAEHVRDVQEFRRNNNFCFLTAATHLFL